MSMIIAHNMSAINTNRQLGVSTRGQSSAMEKLSSGYKINTGKDDPSGLVISEKLRAQEVGLTRAVQNTEEAMNVVGIAEGALNEMNNILKKMKTLAVHAASDGVTSPDQIAADQAEIDSAVQTIDRIARTTKFSDQTLLSGGKEISFDTNTLVQGTQNNKLLDANGTNFDQIFRRSNYAVSIGFTGTQNADSVTGIGDVDFAKQAMKAYLEVDTAKGTLSQVDENGKFTQAQSFILTGSKGSRAFNFDKGASITELVSMIHSSADTTGVDASLVFNSAQSVSKLNVADFNGKQVTGHKFADANEEVKDANGNLISFNFLGELDGKVEADKDFQVSFTGYDDKNNAQFDILYDGMTVVNGWDGKAGRIALGGTLKNLDLEISSDIDIKETFVDAFADDAAIKFDNTTLSAGLFKNATGGGLSITTDANGFAVMEGELASVLGKGGKLEVEVVNGTGAAGTVDMTLNIKAYDKDGNIVAQLDNFETGNQNLGADLNYEFTGLVDGTDAGKNVTFFNGLGLTFGAVTLPASEGGVLIGSDTKGSAIVTSVTLDHTETMKTSEVDLTSLNPANAKKVDTSKYYSARQIDMTVDAGLKNSKNEDILVDVKGKLANIEAFDRAMAGLDPKLTITTNEKSELDTGKVTPTTYTVKFGNIELANNWNGDSKTFNFEGKAGTALEGLTFSIEDAEKNNVNTVFSFADSLTTTTAATLAATTGVTGGSLVAGGGNLSTVLTGISKELQAYLANGYELKAELAGFTGGADLSIANGAAVATGGPTHATILYTLENKSTGDVISESGSLVLTAATSLTAAQDKVTGTSDLFKGIEAALSATTFNTNGSGAAIAVDANDLVRSGTAGAYVAPAKWEIAASSEVGSDRVDRGQFFDALTASTVGKGASVVGGMSHNDDASRTNGTIAVFGNTIASDGSGKVERGVTNVAFERITGKDGVVRSASENIQYGLNTDGQGRVYVKFNRDNNSYELFKDESMSAESKVAEGINGQASTQFNNSGLDGLIIDLESGPNDDLFNEKGVYISFAGIEGRATDAENNNGIAFDGDTIADGGKTKAGSFDSSRTLVTGVELGTNTSEEGRIYTKSVYDHDKGTVQVFAYKDKNMSDENMVAKSEIYNVRDADGNAYKSMSVVLSEIRNDDDTAGTGLGMVLSFEDTSFQDMKKSTELVGNMTFTNIGARIYSQEYGSNAIVKVNQTQGGIFTYYDTAGDNSSQKLLDAGSKGVTKEFKGQDASLSINGQKVTTDGLSLNVATQDIQARLKFQEGKAGTTTIAQVGYGEGSIFTKIGALNAGSVEADEDGISGLICNAGHVTTEKVENFQNGMQLQLGESSGDQDRTVISIQSMTMDALGRVVKTGQWEPGSSVTSEKVFTLQDIMGGGQASLSSNSLIAMEIIEKSINDVTELRARLGAVQSNMLQTNSNNLAVTIENIQKTESGVRDTDMASTMTEFTKQQVLQNAGMTMLSQANSASQNILQILR